MFGLDLYDDAIPQDCEQRYIVDALTEKAVKSKFVQKFHLQCHCIMFCNRLYEFNNDGNAQDFIFNGYSKLGTNGVM